MTTYKELLEMSDLEIAAHGYVQMKDYFEHLVYKGEVVYTGGQSRRPLQYKGMFGSYATKGFESQAEEQYAEIPEYKLEPAITGADYINEYCYKNMRSCTYGADTDFFATLSNGEYEHFGMVEDEVDRFRTEHGITPDKTFSTTFSTIENAKAIAGAGIFVVYKTNANSSPCTHTMKSANLLSEAGTFDNEISGYLYSALWLGGKETENVFCGLDKKVYINGLENPNLEIIDCGKVLKNKDDLSSGNGYFAVLYDKESDKTMVCLKRNSSTGCNTIPLEDGRHDIAFTEYREDSTLSFSDKDGSVYIIDSFYRKLQGKTSVQELEARENAKKEAALQAALQKEREEQAKITQQNEALNKALESHRNVTFLCLEQNGHNIHDMNGNFKGRLNDNNEKYIHLCNKGKQHKGWTGSCYEALLLDVEQAKKMVRNGQLRITVPENMMRFIIGHKGCNIKSVEEELGDLLLCDVKIKLNGVPLEQYKQMVEERNNRGAARLPEGTTKDDNALEI